MRIKKFVAPNVKDAIAQVKTEFGDDAIILSQKKIKVNEDREGIEVTAAIDKSEELKNNKDSFIQHLKKTSAQSSASSTASGMQFTILQKEVEFISERMDLLINHIKYENLPHIPKSLQKKVKSLIAGGVKPSLANSIIEELVLNLKGEDFLNEELIEEKLILKIKSMLQISGPLKFNNNVPATVVIIGPSGAGKTTIAAKLAAINKYKSKKNVCLISADSYRIAAKEQLKSFAEIAKIRFESIYNNSELLDLINQLQSFDLIIIDTAGINPRDMKKMVSLKEMIKVAKADEIHLVLSLTSKESYLRDVIRNFSILSYDSIIYSKIDETNTYGEILNIATDYEKKISYLTNGQSIPEDIITADRKELAELILNKYGNN
ncbi:MAG: hypothetical protein PHR06_06320 [Candidatus Cloacimonetes bacterium]|nr:hypothetical protein [Candidatus Cloacimonadota bacterium]